MPRNVSASLDVDLPESSVPRALSIPFLAFLPQPERGSRALAAVIGCWDSVPRAKGVLIPFTT